jgi:hypothetical protein
MRRFKRKLLKKPVFRLLRDNYGYLYNIRMNLEKLQYIQKFMKIRCQEKKRRRILFGKIIDSLFQARYRDGFKSIRSKKSNDVTMKRLYQVYSENVKKN